MFNLNATSIVRQSKAQTFARIVCRNVRTAAKKHGYGPLSLSRASRVPLMRTIAMWLGITLNMSELFRYATATGLSTEGMFSGTREAVS